MKKIFTLITAVILFSPLSFACNNEAVQQSLENVCKELSKLKEDQIANIDVLPEKNLLFNSCGRGAVIVYSSQAPHKIIRYPLRSWNNNAVENERTAESLLRSVKETLATKKVSFSSSPYGPPSFNIQKTQFALACPGIEKNYPYIVTTNFLTNSQKVHSTAMYFLPPEYEKQRSDYDIVNDTKLPLEKRLNSFTRIYDIMAADAAEQLTKNFSVNKNIVDEYLMNDDTKRRTYNTLTTRYINEKTRVTDVLGAIQLVIESNFTKAPLIDTSNKLLTELQSLKNSSAETQVKINELESMKKLNTETQQRLKELEATKLELGKPNNYTYAVAAALLFFLSSVGLLIALIRK